MNKDKLLEKAIKMAVNAHFGQEDLIGQPYIFHPLRVMDACCMMDEKIVGILHDTIEDTYITKEVLLQEGFPAYMVDAIEHLTKREGEEYDDFITRVMENKLAIPVKIADITDNLNLTRLKEIQEKDIERIKKYLRSLNRLKSV